MESNRQEEKSLASAATYTVAEAGRMVGLSRNGSYDAVRRGEIPVLKFGRVCRVPKATWDKKLGLAEALR
jgi:excisionase family DNA binding protein